MNREIRFRGKRSDTGEWTVGSLIVTHKGFTGITTFTGKFPDGKIRAIIDEVQPETVSQYIGLKDKNGTDVYEGDILCISGFNTVGEAEEWIMEVGQYGEVAYSTADSDYSLLAWIDNFVEYEVVGNIHDNPELMKGGEYGFH